MTTGDDRDRTARYALLVLFGINTMNFFDRQIIAAVTEPIRKEWLLGDTAMGVMGTAFTLIYAAIGVPIGRLSDRSSRTRVLGVGVTVWSLFTAASGLTWSYASLFVARMGVGVGEATCAPAGNSLIGDLYPPSRRARAIAVFMLGLPVGIFLSNLTTGLIAKAYGWRAAFFVATVPGLVLAALALRIREPERGAAEEVSVAGRTRAGSPYARVLGIPTMWWIIGSGALHNFNAYAVNGFLPAYLGRYHGLDVQQANTLSAFTLGAVGIVGLLGGGLAADRARRWRPNGRMLLAAAALAVSTPCVYVALAQPAGAIVRFTLPMAAGWMLIYVYYVTVYPAIQDVVEPSLRGTAMALYLFAMYVLGGSFGTMILGVLSDHYAARAMTAAGASTMTEAFRAAGLHDAFYVVPVVSLVLSAVLLAGALTVSSDVAKLERWMRAGD